MSTSSICATAQSGTQLGSLCACSASSSALQSALTSYENQFTLYNTEQANYSTYVNAQAKWLELYNTEQNSFSSQRQGSSTCAPAGNCQNSAGGCQNGWGSDGTISGNVDNCNIWGVSTGCRVQCSPNQATISNHMSSWQNSNPAPAVVVNPGNSPSAPSGINIQCCSQLFSNITANSVNFSDINQQCGQKIGAQIAAAAASTSNTSASSSSNPSTSSNTTKMIVYIIAGLLIIFLLYFIILN